MNKISAKLVGGRTDDVWPSAKEAGEVNEHHERLDVLCTYENTNALPDRQHLLEATEREAGWQTSGAPGLMAL